jgi:hypothetical protein
MDFLCIQGCKSCQLIGYYEEITVTLDGEPKTFKFGGKLRVSPDEKFLIQLLRRIEQGEVVDANQLIPEGSYAGKRPLEMTIDAELTYERNLGLTRYLLIHGTDPNKTASDNRLPIHRFLDSQRWVGSAVGYEIFSLLLAYGARVNIPLKPPSKETFIDQLDRDLASENFKKTFFTQLATELLQKKQFRPLDKAFVTYLEKIGLDPGLIAQLKNRT